jgi:alkanesulfonate monooxygenase SsuD/methylene tetrahydromethanopterin reductase-like flavin-dependent oxidoreductase (luciferase family)
LVLHPRPVHGRIPILIGGMSRPALRRAAAIGDGWIALAFAARTDEAELAGRLARVHQLRREAKRSSPFEAVLKLHAAATDADKLCDLAARATEIGFDTIVIEPPWSLGLDAATACIAAVRERADRAEPRSRAPRSP